VTGKADKAQLKRLETEGGKRGLPPRLLEFYQKLLRIRSEAEKQLGTAKVSLRNGDVTSCLENGVPLLSFDKLNIDWALLKGIFKEVTATFADYADIFGEMPRSLRDRAQLPSLPKKVVRAWFEKTALPPALPVKDANEYLLLEAIIHTTLQPFLVSHARALHSLVEPERWRRGYCPICSGSPDFCYLDREQGARWLICSRCDSEWLFQRLQCPYCGNQNQNTLAYFTDDKESYRLYVCDQCHRYLKAIDLRRTQPILTLPLERLLTLDIDRQAQEKGYRTIYSEDPGNSPD